MSARQQVLKAIRPLEVKAQMVDEWRDVMVNEKGRLTDDAKAFVQLAKAQNFKQAWIARFLGVTAPAINYHYNK